MKPTYYHLGLLIMIVTLTLLIGMMVQLLPLPSFFVSFKPDIVLMIWVYWLLALPQMVSLGYTWLLSLIMDALLGVQFGTHGLAFTPVAFLVTKFHLQIRMYPLWQQSVWIMLLLMLNRFIIFVLEYQSGSLHWFDILSPSLVHVLIWPWVFRVCRALRHKSISNQQVPQYVRG